MTNRTNQKHLSINFTHVLWPLRSLSSDFFIIRRIPKSAARFYINQFRWGFSNFDQTDVSIYNHGKVLPNAYELSFYNLHDRCHCTWGNPWATEPKLCWIMFFPFFPFWYEYFQCHRLFILRKISFDAITFCLTYAKGGNRGRMILRFRNLVCGCLNHLCSDRLEFWFYSATAHASRRWGIG